MNMLAEMSWGQWLLALLLIFVCWLLMLVILLQKNRGGGLAGAFGSAGGSGAFGAKTGDVFTWFTVIVTGVFVVLASAANFVFDESAEAKSTTSTELTPSDPVSPEGAPVSQPIQVKVGEDGKLTPIGGGDLPFKFEFEATPSPTPGSPTEGEAKPAAPTDSALPTEKPAEAPRPEEKKEPSSP